MNHRGLLRQHACAGLEMHRHPPQLRDAAYGQFWRLHCHIWQILQAQTQQIMASTIACKQDADAVSTILLRIILNPLGQQIQDMVSFAAASSENCSAEMCKGSPGAFGIR